MMHLEINLAHSNYKCIIERGIFERLETSIDFSKEIIILTDDNLFNLYLKDKNLKAKVIVVNPGEESKSLKTYQSVIEQLIYYNISKDATLIAFGGGVIGDLGGFVAQTYLRGIKLIQIPTTLLAQIDSSIGGKVALNVGGIKNSIGGFYHPSLVLIDPILLDTLPKRQFNNGIAELIKYGLIRDEKIINLLENERISDIIDELIYRSLIIKKEIVELDEFDSHYRHILNFGHTLGHAIESFYDFKKYLHGEAVSIGMARITQDQSFNKRILTLLQKFDLPITDEASLDDLLPFIQNDKKKREENINIVLLEQIGQAKIEKININQIHKYLLGGTE